MGPFGVERGRHQGYEAVRLLAAGLSATFLPGLGLVGVSLCHAGAELLGRTENLARYASEGSTLGIPLLHPWANRLPGARYRAGGADVELDVGSPLLHLDGNGLPIHGVVGPRLPWRVVAERADEVAAALTAELDYSAPELLAVFPFPHRLRQEVSLAADGLTIATELTPTADRAVPISFGFHPYLVLPGLPRAQWRFEAPPLERLVLDARSLPTGVRDPWPGLAGPLDRDYDDGFAGVGDGTAFALAGGGRRIEVTFLEGYPYAQLFAPPGQEYVCVEPMTAPTGALASGEGLRFAAPGKTFRAAFRVAVS